MGLIWVRAASKVYDQYTTQNQQLIATAQIQSYNIVVIYSKLGQNPSLWYFFIDQQCKTFYKFYYFRKQSTNIWINKNTSIIQAF